MRRRKLKNQICFINRSTAFIKNHLSDQKGTANGSQRFKKSRYFLILTGLLWPLTDIKRLVTMDYTHDLFRYK